MAAFGLIEVFATVSNILANLHMMQNLCVDANGPVPRRVLALQMMANFSWMAYAVLGAHDVYLASTAGMSLIIQSTSLYLRSRARRKIISPDSSQTSLRQFEG
jgi:hypothetical protein